MLGAILQSFISLSIHGVRSSFFAQIEAEINLISHKKLISKSNLFEGMILVSKSMVKSQSSHLGIGSQVQTPGMGRSTFVVNLGPDEIEWVQCGNISSQTVATSFLDESNLRLMFLKHSNWQHSLALLPWVSIDFQNGMD